MTNLRVLHHRALQVCVDLVDQVGTGQLGLATPCAEWDLGQLLAHMTGQNRGFAASARGESSDLGVFAPVPVSDAPGPLHARSAADLTDAFAAADPAAQFWLPEIRAGGLFPAQTAFGFHLVDSVAHGWDVARSIGVPVAFDAEVLDAALMISLAIPDGPARERPDASFRPGVGVNGDAGIFERILALLGRSPDWAPPQRSAAQASGAV
ncbi:MAG: TIGR03086 family metal-binding protein [Actinocrinis sp.]